MPLSPAVAREHMHTRTVEVRGYHRADGLWDIEARLEDTKTYAFPNRYRGEIGPGEPIHGMWLRVTIDDDMRIHEVEAATDASPFAVCPAITGNFRRLAGLTIGPGFMRAVHARVGGVEGCTHLVELLRPVATTAVQTLSWQRRKRAEASDAAAKAPRWLDTCHAYRRDGPVVREHWPEHYTGPVESPAGDPVADPGAT